MVMKNLKNLFLTPLQLARIPRWIPIILIILALIGFADAAYLTIEHYQNEIPPCTIGGCETVLTSQYAEIAGLPVSLFGAKYYLTLLIILFIYLDSKKEIFLRIPLLLSTLGALASLSLMFIMFFIIKSFCLYCTISAIVSLTIFIISIYAIAKSRNNQAV